ncbi:MAG: hypothetical protein LHW56_11115 [Candidatus Cloacimonetes bacterium]|nr:hypothetical protein [Candidatus Cloacimonadota bacterium]MDY0173441.1 hypothetical protein [Candidatus Cloacimonadaceae bacterium]
MSESSNKSDRMDLCLRPPYEVDMQSSGFPADIIACGLVCTMTAISMGASLFLAGKTNTEKKVR